MGRRDYVPRKDSLFLQWMSAFIQNLTLMAARINFPDTVLQELRTLFSDFSQKYLVSKDPATRTKVSVKAKDLARKELEKKTRLSVNEFLAYNHLVANGDRISLGLHIRDYKSTPSPVADKAPIIKIETPSPAVVELHIITPKPHGQHSGEFIWAILDKRPVNWSELTHSSFCTHSPLRLSFEGENRGKTLYFAVRWVNTRLEKGNLSEIQSVIIR
jgi:hypothetical protein